MVDNDNYFSYYNSSLHSAYKDEINTKRKDKESKIDLLSETKGRGIAEYKSALNSPSKVGG